MKTLDFNKVLRDFQYKPNFRCAAYEREKGEWWVRIVMFVEDSRKPLEPWDPQPYPVSQRDLYFEYDIVYNRYRTPEAPEYYSPSRAVIEVMGNYPIPKYFEGDDEAFVSWMVYTIREVEKHEQDEWFRYKGELLNDPHKE